MKTKLLPGTWRTLLLAAFASAIIIACDDDEKPKTVPVVTTKAVTDVTTTTAIGGGEIASDGNAAVTSSGLCYSSTQGTPTITDDTTKTVTSIGSFTDLMDELASGTQYHVRAYATNSVGTGYGEVVTFTTGNAAPIATNVTITGTVQVNKTLTASYAYSDAENDLEIGTTLQWYSASDGVGSDEAAIVGATSSTYTLQDVDEFKFIRIGITPKAASGTTAGMEVKSDYVGPVAEAIEVTFTYNGEMVTYGIITSSVTGRKWLDRNMGAPNAPTAYDDWANYGDLFQWGRAADGHQLINMTSEASSTTAENGIITTLSSTDKPNHHDFIGTSISPYDWRSPQNDNLWQGPNGANNPCPDGWHVPTKAEWEAENLTSTVAYTQLKITKARFRYYDNGEIVGNNSANYWTSTIYADDPIQAYWISASDGSLSGDFRAAAYACRCIKNE